MRCEPEGVTHLKTITTNNLRKNSMKTNQFVNRSNHAVESSRQQPGKLRRHTALFGAAVAGILLGGQLARADDHGGDNNGNDGNNYGSYGNYGKVTQVGDIFVIAME